MQSEFSADEHHRTGLQLLEGGEGQRGFDHLCRAYLKAPDCASYRSSYALALALVRGQFLGAVELARASVRQEFYNPDLYLNSPGSTWRSTFVQRRSVFYAARSWSTRTTRECGGSLRSSAFADVPPSVRFRAATL